jgi:acyl-CoA reductase-like NAD-dependent aldehyde dehydrogenase
MKKYKMYINGEWVEALNGQFYEDRSPYSGEVVGLVPAAGAEDAKLAIDAAQAAFTGWAAFSPIEKRKLLIKAADIIDRRMEEFADMLALETGAAQPFAKFQAHTGPEFLREAASQVFDVHGTIFPSELPDCTSMMWRQPVGVVGCISPWNAAMLLALRAVTFPLAYGNTVVLKTSEASSIVGGIMLAEVFEEAGFPKGVFNLVTNGPGGSAAIGDVFTSDKRVRRITFTGSTEVGRHLAIQSAQNLKKICLELGGNCPLIILKDADVDYAVNAAAFGRYMHQGQVCMNTKRIVVERPIAEEFIEKLTVKTKSLKFGNPAEPDTIVGPLINESQMKKLQAQISRAREQGARITCGGASHGLVYEPTVLVMTEDMDIAHEEVFGPVANVIIAEDEADALRIANNTDYGLSSGIITRDTIKAWEFAEKLEAGCCHINDSTLGDENHAPLGGMKDSGWGKNGFMALEEFTEVRWVTLQKKPRKYFF